MIWWGCLPISCENFFVRQKEEKNIITFYGDDDDDDDKI